MLRALCRASVAAENGGSTGRDTGGGMKKNNDDVEKDESALRIARGSDSYFITSFHLPDRPASSRSVFTLLASAQRNP